MNGTLTEGTEGKGDSVLVPYLRCIYPELDWLFPEKVSTLQWAARTDPVPF